jgi:class 3 adenylate cyclase/tetratricopeptide (TPR) repeat protein
MANMQDERQVVVDCFNRGDLSVAYDLCRANLLESPDDLWLRHRAVLCLLRSGALKRAEQDYRRFKLAEAIHDEDCLALGARLLKAMALEATGDEFRRLASVAARKYEDVFQQTNGHYPGINAATMYRLAGDVDRSRDIALRVIHKYLIKQPNNPEQAYYLLASQAEAYCLLGDFGAAQIALRGAIAKDPANFLAQATTNRQLNLLLETLGVEAPWLESLAPPRPCHFAGHLFSIDNAALDASDTLERSLAHMIEAAFEKEKVGPVYGAVAAGVDILFAETAVLGGNELHVVLPVPVNTFIETSVKPYGRAWVKRCETCLESAVEIHEVTTDHKLLSDRHLRYASEVAMGLTRMHADVLATSPVQILAWDGKMSGARYGTGRDAEVWRSMGQRQVNLNFDPEHLRRPLDNISAQSGPKSGFSLTLRAMLFVDVCGSTGVSDDLVPVFVKQVLGVLATACEAMNPVPEHANSWGDGLFLSFRSSAQAADAAITLQKTFDQIDLAALGLPDHLALRIGGHYGPVFEGVDPMQKKPSLFGGQVATAARIEPVTVPGSIFVSKSMAAALAIEAAERFRCEYVGLSGPDTQLADFPLYSLRAVSPGSPASLARRTSRGVRELGEQSG